MTHNIVTPLSIHHKGTIHSQRPSLATAGFSLIEVLVSIIVLSFGLLGVVGMQAAALQANKESRYQSIAVGLIRELAETIRANKAEGVKPAAANPYLGSFSTSPLTPVSSSYCLSVGASACTSTTDIAKAQLTEWLARVDDELPGARVALCFDSAPYDADGLPHWNCDNAGNILVIKISWTHGSTDRSKTGTDALERADASSRPLIVLPVTAGSST
jgi:type IV pilus assembly protein PilV